MDALNTYAKQNLFNSLDTFKEYLKFNRLQKKISEKEQQETKGLSLSKHEDLIYNKQLDGFLNPVPEGIVPEDCLQRYVQKKLDILSILIVGNEDSYIM